MQIDEKRVTSNGGFVSPPKPNQGAFRTMSNVLWVTPMDNITISSYDIKLQDVSFTKTYIFVGFLLIFFFLQTYLYNVDIWNFLSIMSYFPI